VGILSLLETCFFFHSQKHWAVQYFIENGAPREKLILGLATYGKSFIWNSNGRMIGDSAKYDGYYDYKQVLHALDISTRRSTQFIIFMS
jgi:hypothetical protein